ncbi:hypothetical protein Lesp02_36800 [Lentzea sp. NBRC 105346]|nr:hypothetical protein Lesp02_36800 [Lentzea sp. NBRC 105346]
MVGPVGVGKTRLAVEVAARLKVPDGVWFVDLVAVRDPAQVDQAVASAVGTKAHEDGARAALAEHLRDREVLLLLDNCEHVIGSCAGLVTWLLDHCPGVRVLATSREVLALPEERCLALAPLPVRSDAVKLFEDRATAVDHEFTVTDAVVELCRDLDGLPLAIELAARRVRYLPTADLATLLRTGDRVSDRHRSLDAAIAWSYDLLSPREQLALRRLSALAGPFDGSLATATCGIGELRHILAGLAAKSLVIVENDRFRLLEAIRLFGQERMWDLGEAEETYERVVTWFAELLESQLTRYQLDPAVIRALHDQRDSLAAVASWAVTDRRRPLLLWGLTLTWARHGHLTEGATLLRDALAEHPPPEYESPLLTTLASIEEWRHNTGEAVALGLRAVEIEESLGRLGRLARAHGGIGTALEAADALDGARRHQLRALELLRECDDPTGVGIVQFNLACLALRTGDLDAAEEALAEARALMTSHGNTPTFLAALWQAHGELAAARGTFDVAAEYFAKSLRTQPDLPRQVVYGLGGLALVAIAVGEFEHGLRLAESASTLQGDLPVLRYWQCRIDQAVMVAMANLPADRAKAARAEGRAMSLTEAVGYALDGVRTDRSPLSPRQLEICRSVAKGRTDRQIARELGVSVRTTNAYLEEIRAKLGVRNRAELAAWITRHDRA